MHREIRLVRSVMLVTSITVALSLAAPAGVYAAPSEPNPAPSVAEIEPEIEPQPNPEAGEASEPATLVSPPSPPPPAPAIVLPPPTPIEVDPANYRMVLAGNIVIGLGGAGLIAMAVGLGLRADAVTQRQAQSVAAEPDLDAIARQDRRIHDGNITGLVGGVAAGALFVTGITLVALGYERERKRRLMLPGAMVGRDGVAIHWAVRF